MASQTAYLSPLDQYMPRIPVVIYLVFATPDVPSALAALQSGLDKMTDHLPFLRGFVSVPSHPEPATDADTTDPEPATTTDPETEPDKPDNVKNEPKGRIAITYSANDAPLTLLHLQGSLALTLTPGETENTFSALLATRFPPSIFSNTFGALLAARREALALPVEKGDPAFAASYAVLDGGLVVGVAAHHTLVDGTGMAELVRFWGVCTSCASSGGGELELGEERMPRGDEVLRRGELLWGGVARGGRKEGEGGFEGLVGRVRELKVRGEDVVSGGGKGVPVPKGGTKLFGFDGDKLERARVRLREASGWDTKALSVNNILCAVMWGCITRARAARQGGKLDRPTSKLGFAVNGRRQLGREFAERPYLGNVNIFGLPEVDASTLTDIGATCHAEGDLACLLPVIGEIYGAIKKVTAGHIGDVMSLMEQAPDVTKVEANWVRSHGADLAATSWANMGIYESDFGSYLGKPQFMRVPAFESDGLVIIMPRKRPSEQGVAEIIEVAAVLNAEDLAALETDDIWKSWLA